MARQNRLKMKNGKPKSLEVIYSKRRDRIVKKATELSILCDVDVGLIMFSPVGRLTTFASNGRIEDIFLRYLQQPGQLRGGAFANDDHLYQSIKHFKYEGEMLEKIEKIEALREKLRELDHCQRKTLEKLRYYNPVVDMINSVEEAQRLQEFLVDAIGRIEKLKASTTSVDTKGMTFVNIEESTTSSTEGKSTRNESTSDLQKTTVPLGPHLSINYLEAQSHWNLHNMN